MILIRRRIVLSIPLLAAVLAVSLGFATTAAAAAPTFTAAGQFGSEGSGPGEFSSPVGVAVDQSDGHVYVADEGNDRVQELEASGSFIAEINGSETPEGQSGFEPHMVAVSSSTHSVYVVNQYHETVDEFSEAGTYITQITGSETPQGTGWQPEGVAVDPTSQDVYVVDGANGHVDVFSASGTYERQFGNGYGSGEGQFTESHTDPAFGPNGEVYVVDRNEESERVQEFNASGAFVSTFYTGAREAGPTAVAVDTQTGDVFIGMQNQETGGYAVEVFEPNGTPISSFGSSIGSEGGFSEGIAIDSSSGDIYVADFVNDHIDIFSQGSGACTPAVTSSGSASEETATSVKLTGELNPEGCATTYDFRYGKTTAYEASAPIPAEAAPAGSSEESVSAQLTGLEPNTTYHFELVAASGAASVHGADETFTTKHAPPTVTTGQATDLKPGFATLNGTVDARNTATTYQFQYGTSTGYGSEAPLPEGSAGTGSIAQVVSTVVSDLSQATTYHYRLVATNSAGETEYGADETLTTPTISLTTGLAGAVSQTTATVEGTLNPDELATTYEFQYGTSTAYGANTILGRAGSGEGYERVVADLTGLTPGTTYHYRLAAIDAAGTAYGEDATFTTYPSIPASGPQALSVGQSGTELTSPTSPPLLPTLTPTGSPPSSTTSKPKTTTRAEKLSKALKQCKRDKSKTKRKSCDRSAHTRYGPKHKPRKNRK